MIYLLISFILVMVFFISFTIVNGFSMKIFIDFLGFLTKMIPLIVLGLLVTKIVLNNDYSSNDLIEISRCKLLEENHYNGIFSENTNKLDCGGVIKNVPMSDYDKAIYHSTDDKK